MHNQKKRKNEQRSTRRKHEKAMPTQRPLTSSIRRISSKPSNRLTNRSASLPRTSENVRNRKSASKFNQTINRPAKAFTEKQISQRREREQQNIEKWQQIDKYFRQNKARLDLYEHWNQKELRRTKSTGSHLNHLGLNSMNDSLDQLNSNSLSHLDRVEELDVYWSTDRLFNTTRSNQQLAKKIEDQLCSELINELYIIDPRKIPYDIDVDLLRKPEAVDKLKAKVKKQENKLKMLKEQCLQVKQSLISTQSFKTKLIDHKKQLEELYLEYSKNWLEDSWQKRFNKLELQCCDEELIFPARKGQLKGKDRLRLRNNLVSEHFERCRKLLLQVRRLSGHHKVVKKVTNDDNNLKTNLRNKKQNHYDRHNCQQNEAYDHNLRSNLENSKSSNNQMQSYLMQMLSDDERQVLSNVMQTTINMLVTYTSLIKRRASLYTSLFDEEVKSVWFNETNDLKERIKVCITLMNKIYQLYATIYAEKIEFLNKQIEKLNSELETRIESFDKTLDQMKHDPNKQLILSLIDRSLLTGKE